jgi:hypothetical protein
VVAAGLLTGSGGGQQTSARSATAGVLDESWGRWLVGAIGVAFVAGAAYEAWQALTKEFMDDLDTGSMAEGTRRVAERVGQAGLLARGVAWALIGWFLVQAAVQFDPKEAKGLDQALRSLADESWGPVVLVLVALGFLGYGAYCVVQARYRRVGHG